MWWDVYYLVMVNRFPLLPVLSLIIKEMKVCIENTEMNKEAKKESPLIQSYR